MKIDSHTPHVVPIGDNRHSPLRLLHEPNTTGTMRHPEHRKAEYQNPVYKRSLRAMLQRQRERLKL